MGLQRTGRNLATEHQQPCGVQNSAEKPAGISLVCYLLLPLVAFNIFSLYLIFVSLISICLSIFLLGFILFGTLCTLWTWVIVSFPMLWKIPVLISLNFCLGPFSLSSTFGTLIMQASQMFNIGTNVLTLPQKFLKLSSVL